MEKMWINLRLNFDNADVNSSTTTTLKVTPSPSATSNVKVTSLGAATALDTSNQK